MTEAAQAVTDILLEHHGHQPWIAQLADMVKQALQNGIDQIGHDGPVRNAQPFIDGQPRAYAMEARTAAELLSQPAPAPDRLDSLRHEVDTPVPAEPESEDGEWLV